MIAASQFDALLVGHLTGDFLLQTRWMAANKANRWVPLLVHSAVYTAVIMGFAALFGNIHAWAVALIFVSHAVLDQRTFVRWWSARVQGLSPGSSDAWVTIVADQAFHVLVLLVVAAFH